MQMNSYPILMYISIFSSVLPLGVGISRIKILHRGMNILFFYLIFAFVSDVYLTWFVRGYQFTLGLFHAYYLIEYVFIISIIIVWQESQRMKGYFQVLMLLYILFWVVAKFTFEPLSGLYSITACTSQVLLTLGAEITLLVVIGNRIQSLTNNYRFWVLLSFIIYYAGTLLIIASRGILIHYSIETLYFAASIDWSLKIIFNILFTIGFLCPQTQT
jgi:hypothetical protein